MCRLFVFMLAPVALRVRSISKPADGPVSGFSTFDAYDTDDGQAELAFQQFEREGDSGREPTTYDRKKS